MDLHFTVIISFISKIVINGTRTKCPNVLLPDISLIRSANLSLARFACIGKMSQKDCHF